MTIKKQAMALLAGAAAVSTASHAQAQEGPRPGEVAVAVVDVATTKIDFDDPNVRIVQANPGAQMEFASREANRRGNYSHGDIVASSFVREFRKLEPTRPIVIYAVNAYIDRGNGLGIDVNAISRAMPALRAANVRVAISAFGTATEESGDRFLRPFLENNITVFAAAPNEPLEGGIYPAASPSAIGVATEDREGYFSNTRNAGRWVDFTIDGRHASSTPGVGGRGTSFAVAHAAAYGVYVADRNPSLNTDGIRQEIAGHGEVFDRRKQTVRIGGREMIARITAASRQPSPASEIDVAVLAQHQQAAAGRGR